MTRKRRKTTARNALALPPAKPRDRAAALLKLQRAMYAEAQLIRRKKRDRERESRKRAAERREAERRTMQAIGAALKSGVPLHVIEARRRLAWQQTGAAGDVPNEQDHADVEARLAIRLQRHRRGRATYWAVVGDPPRCGPGDHGAAAIFAGKLLRAIEQGGWTRPERASLHALYRRWSRRARGEDARFNVVGLVAGRLPRDLERAIAVRGDRGTAKGRAS